MIELVRKLDKRKQMIVLDVMEAAVKGQKDGMSIEEVMDKVRSDVKTNL